MMKMKGVTKNVNGVIKELPKSNDKEAIVTCWALGAVLHGQKWKISG
jgi:hypothetical protein